MSEVFFEILTPVPLNTKGEARRLFEIWIEQAPGYFPDRHGVTEPLRKPFSPTLVEEAIKGWQFMFIMKRVALPKLNSIVMMQYGPHREHSTWKISLRKLAGLDEQAFCNLLRRASVVFSADLALIHSITVAELDRGLENGTIKFLDTSRRTKDLYVAAHRLWKYIPDVYWAMVFGKPYVELFGRERLLTAPAYSAVELENGSVFIQLTPSLKDAMADEAEFELKRTAVRDHLNSNAFFDLAKASDHRYAVPEFAWIPELH